MLTAARDRVAPETRKGRTATVRPFTNFHSSNGYGNSITSADRQCSTSIGLTVSSASRHAAAMCLNGRVVLQDGAA